MPTPDPRPRRREPEELFVGALLLAAAGLGIYASLRGLWAYAHGSMEAFADPQVCLLILIAAPWGLGVSRRLFQGSRSGEALLPNHELLIGSILALLATAWLLMTRLGTLRMVLGFGAIGLAGLALWWRRRGEDRPARFP